jgi:hypothetical protein
VALISGVYDNSDVPGRNPNCRRGVQEYLAHLESTIRGKPGRPVEDPEPFIPVEASELVDGPVVAPPPETPKRKRKAPRKADMPARDRDAVNLASFARKLKGET